VEDDALSRREQVVGQLVAELGRAVEAVARVLACGAGLTIQHVKAGRAPDVRSVFHHYLVKGKPGFVHHEWASLQDAVGWIGASGGIAVIAHPGRYKFSKFEMHEFVSQFRDCGGGGIEVVTGSHSPEQYVEFAQLSREFGLLASRGSDYHGKGESRADLGELPHLSDSLRPVWHDW